MNKEKIVGNFQVSFAYICWGFLTVFWNLLANVNSVYVLMQRIIWSMVFMFILMKCTGRMGEIKSCFSDRKKLSILFVCGILISANWGSYIIAINSGHVLDASLGYFVEPIIVTFFGMLVFREKLHPLEKITLLFSIAGLIYMIASTKTFPSMALFIAGTFAVYAAVKKNLKDITPAASLFMETLCVTPFALVYMVVADLHGFGSVGFLQGAGFLLLPACGLITSIPLLTFNEGVRKIPFYMSGIFMYLNPTIQFLMGCFYFHEAMDKNRLIAFIIIWIGCCFTIAQNLLFMKNEGKK